MQINIICASAGCYLQQYVLFKINGHGTCWVRETKIDSSSK